MSDDSPKAISREVTTEANIAELAAKAGVTEESAAIVEAEVRNGDLVVTVAGKEDPQETTHRLPDEIQETFRRCDDCGEGYGSASRTCPNCGSTRTEFDIA